MLAGVGIWLYFYIAQGASAALETVWILLIAVSLGVWTLGMRLRYDEQGIELSIGPWRRGVHLKALTRVEWRMTGGWRSRGMLFLHDQSGSWAPIYVGRFGREAEWAAVVLTAADLLEVPVDRRAEQILRAALGDR